jgi:hypothetical protein
MRGLKTDYLELFTTPSSIMLNIPCPGVAYQIDALYKSGPSSWPLNAQKHDKLPPPHSTKQAFFCACMWERIPPPPANTTIWTPQARKYLAILWFQGDFHEGRGPYFTAAHYHECLALLLGHRVEQFQVFAMINHMRNSLPQEWTDGAKYEKDSPEVVAVFDKLSENWEKFFRNFDMYKDLKGSDLNTDFEGKAYWAERQVFKLAMVSADIEKDLKKQGAWVPINTRKLEWATEISVEDFEDEEAENENEDMIDLDRAVKRLTFKRNGIVLPSN